MEYLYRKNGIWCWNPDEVLMIDKDENIYLIDNNDVLIFYHKLFNINDSITPKSRCEIIFYISNFGFYSINKSLFFEENKDTGVLCNFCIQYYDETFTFKCLKERFRICVECKKSIEGKKFYGHKPQVHVNNKYENIGTQIEIFTKYGNIIKCFYKRILNKELFDFFTLINVPWFTIQNDNICQRCYANKKYNNYVCKQCYNFSFTIVYQQYCNVLLLKDMIENDIYFNIRWFFLYLINYDFASNYQKSLIRKIPIVKQEAVIPNKTVEAIKSDEMIDDYLIYMAGNIEEPDYSDLGIYPDSNEE